MNQIQSIYPYPTAAGLWAFDDKRTNLVEELLVGGTDEIIDELIRDQLGLTKRTPFTLIFSHVPFPGHQLALRKARVGDGGTWYARVSDGKEGWLCPALFLYFKEAPRNLYARAVANPK